MQCAYTLLSFVTRSAVQKFSTLSNKWYNTQKKNTDLKMCVLGFSTCLSETSLFLRIIEQDINKNMNWSSCEAPVIFVRF
jgi:glutaredoxin 2